MDGYLIFGIAVIIITWMAFVICLELDRREFIKEMEEMKEDLIEEMNEDG